MGPASRTQWPTASLSRWFAKAALTALWSLATCAASAAQRPPIDTLQQIAPALLSCWRVPDDVGTFEVRVRLSLKRDGSVLGQPRIVFSRFTGGPAAQRVVVRSVVEAFGGCTPLPLTPSLGGAIAGRTFTILFAPPSRRV